MATNPGPPSARPGAGGKPASKLHALAGKRPWLVIGGAAAAVVVAIALIKKSTSAASSTPSTSTTTDQLPTYDSSLYDLESEFQSQFEGLQSQIAQLTQNQAGSSSSSSGSGSSSSSGSGTGPAGSMGANPPTAPAPPAPTPQPSIEDYVYRVQPGDSLSSIAAQFGETWQQVWAYNIGSGPNSAERPASTIQTLLNRGPNLLYSNEEIDVPVTVPG